MSYGAEIWNGILFWSSIYVNFVIGEILDWNWQSQSLPPLRVRCMQCYPNVQINCFPGLNPWCSCYNGVTLPLCQGCPPSIPWTGLQSVANAASGMAVHDDCKLRFMELKTKRTYRFIVFKIEEKQKQVIVEKVGEPAQSYEDFTASLPADECRYAVYDFDFMTAENVPKSRIFFIAWSPDTSRVRSKMIYASSKDRFKRELDGIQVELQATDPTEMGLDVFKSRAN
ncbi:unnamed protein product [Camellia sinensis]